MAEHLGKDEKTYSEEYSSFTRELKSFHDQRGTSFTKLPRLHGHEVDLYLLYSLVTSRGGWEKININGDWESLLPYFGIHRLCANGPIALKQIYIRYLDVYERIHFLGEEVDRRESELHEEDDARNRRKALRLLHATPTSYNTAQHLISDQVRNTTGLSVDGIQVTATERIFLSLLCPLPNEQDFAINVCSLLAMESRKPFPLHHCPRIVDALLAHAGIFSQVDIRDLFSESYRRLRGQNLSRFWRDVVPDSDIVQLSDEDLVAKSQEDDAAVFSYWSQPPVKEKLNGIHRTSIPLPADLDMDEASVSSDGDDFQRPLDSVRPVDTSLMEQEVADDSIMDDGESHCSEVLYENGTGPMSASVESSDALMVASQAVGEERAPGDEPNFKNCLSKTTNNLGVVSNQEKTMLNHSPVQTTLHSKSNGELPLFSGDNMNEQVSTEEVDTTTKETTVCDATSLEKSAAGELSSTLITDGAVIGTEAPQQVEVNVERKIPLPRNKLPVAVLKPDNPRAIRYWLDQRRIVSCNAAQQKNVEEDEAEKENGMTEPDDWDLFHLGRDQGVHDVLGQRVLQVLNVIRNLSFDEVNSSVLAQSEACMRLLLLAAHAKWSCLPQLAFDALSNLSVEINLKDPADCSLSAILLGTVTRGLESSDRFIVLRCMETLCRLAQRSDNETLLMSSLDAHVYERLCSYLTIPDVALLIYTLECVYALSSLGQATCNAFLNCQGAMDVLISLLTIEAQSYGSRARILMSVVETVAEGSESMSSPAQLNPIHTTMRPMHPNSPAPSAPSTPPPMLLQPVATTVPTTPMCHTKILPKPTVNSRPSTPTQSKPNVGIISHTEKEQIAMQWLRATFEPVVGASSIEQNVLYRQYTAACSRSGPKQVLGLVQFFSCVRATFGQNVGPFRKQVGTGVEYYFEGMCPKSNVSGVVASASAATNSCPSPTPNTNAIEVPGSPILKAQLCAPPKATARKDNTPKPSLAHPHLSQALCQSGSVAQAEPQVIGLGQGTPAVSAGVTGGSGPPPSSSLIKSLLANKVPDNNCPPVNHVANLGLSPTATALPGMTRVSCMNAHVSSIPLTTSTITTTTVAPSLSAAPHQQVAQRQQQQRLLQQQHQPAVNNTANNIHPAFRTSSQASLPKVNGVMPSEMALSPVSAEGGDKLGSKGMLADLLEREVKKEPVNGAAPLVEKELRISDNGLELVPKDPRNPFAVDMGVVGMNDLGVDLGDGAAAPKAAHLIAQVDDSGHVQIHLEEEADSGMSLCNGQSLLDQLEACEVSSSTDSIVANKAVKRPPEQMDEKDSPALKKAMTNHIAVKAKANPGDSASTVEGVPSTEPMIKEKTVKNGNLVNGSVEPNVTISTPVTAVSATTVVQSFPAFPSQQQLQVQQLQHTPVLVGPNAPHTFYILQPQSQQQAKLGFPAQGQRLLLAIQRPGGVVQHVAMPANVVAISSNQLQTNGGIVTLTTSGNITSVINAQRDSKSTISESITASSSPAAILSTTAITTVAASSVVTTPTSSMEGVVTFSGGAVAFPARPTENSARTSNSSAPESHVTITPVSAATATTTVASTIGTTSSSSAPAVSNASAASKKKTTSGDSSKPRGRPTKSKSTDGQLTSSPSPQPSDPSLPYLCEWKECMRSFKTPHEVYVHACQAHCPAHIEELGCLWDRCDGLKRRRFSMMTHLMDRHCNDEMQKLLAARRHQINTQGKTDIPPPQAPTPHPGYAPHAALHAIKRHAVELMNQKEQEEKEGPVTKSIRLTSALILRNIAMYSSSGRRSLQRYEGHLASVALSNVESSRTVAQILFELTHQSS